MASIALDSSNTQVAPEILGKLQSVRAWKIAVGLLRVVLVSTSVLVLLMLLAMWIDWFTLPGNSVLRPWLTSASLGVSAVVAVYGVARVLIQCARLPLVAIDVDSAHPELEERWSSLTESSAAAARGHASHPAMYRKLAGEAVSYVPKVTLLEVVPPSSLLPSALVLGLVFALLAAPFFWDSQRIGMLVSRFWSPTSDITLTKFGSVPQELVVAKHETAVIQVNLDGRTPESATLEIRYPDGREKNLSIDVTQKDSPLALHRVTNVENPFQYRWSAGDAQSGWTPVTVATRPRLVEVRFKATAPEYAKREPLREKKLPSRVRVLEGSTLDIAFRADMPLKSLMLEIKDGEPVSLDADGKGWCRWKVLATDDIQFSPILTESHGLTNRNPQTCRVQVYRDLAPTVEILSPSPDTRVRPEDDVDIHFEALDDVGLERAELVVQGEASENGEREILKTIPIDLGKEKGSRKIRGVVTLPLAELGIRDGQAISYSIQVHDNRVGPAPVDLGAPLATSYDPMRAASDPRTSSDSDSPIERTSQVAMGEDPPSRDSMPSGEPSSPTQANEVNTANKTDPNRAVASDTNPAKSQQSGNALKIADANSSNDQSPRPGEGSPPTAGSTNSSEARSLPAPRDSSDHGVPANTIAITPPRTAMPLSETKITSPQTTSAPGNQPQSSPSPADDAASSSSPGQTASGLKIPPQTGGGTAPPSEAQNGSPEGEPKPQAEGDTSASASSGEQSLTTSSQPNNPSGGNSGSSKPDSSESNNREQGTISTPEGSVPLDKSQPPSDKSDGSKEGSSNDPGDLMSKRMLDLPQTGSSAQRELKVDEWAGSFEGQQREKLAIAISPVLYELDKLLAAAERSTDGVASRLESSSPWNSEEQRQIQQSDKTLKRCEQAVAELQGKTDGTPYAFIGLQLQSIIDTNVTPARDSIWEALDSGNNTAGLVRSAWEDIRRARARLDELTKSFDRIHRDHRLAEKADRIKKMYRVFIENAMAELGSSPEGINNYERRMAELELDDEYLKRLQEVLEMRRDLQAELAGLLRDDPRLMRRYMDNLSRRGDTLRDQMTLLAERQKQVAKEVRAWQRADDESRPALLAAIVSMRQIRLDEISQESANISERLITWLPLDLRADEPALADAVGKAKNMAAKGALLAASAPEDENRPQLGLDLYNAVNTLDEAIRHVNLGREHGELNSHLLNRLGETRRLNQVVSSWVRQDALLRKGQFLQESAIEQYKLAMETDLLAGKLYELERQLTSNVSTDPAIASKIGQQAHELLVTLDTELAANQLAATFALKSENVELSVEKELAAVSAFQKTEKLFDELMRGVIDELDKIPPEDPIASLLQEPTLDELLALLENETNFLEVLGIPSRPSNLQIVQDWMQPNQSGGSSGGARMFAGELRREQRDAKNSAEKAMRQALAQALAEEKKHKPDRTRTPSRGMPVDWNTLLSTLDDELRQGKSERLPQEYRRMIEQYFSRVSELEGEVADVPTGNN